MTLVIKNISRQEIIAYSVRYCYGLFDRLKGLLGTSSLDEKEACWLTPCNSIHTIGMKYPIDVYFLNKKKKVIAVLKNMKPLRFSPIFFRAACAIEFASGPERNCKVGDQLTLEEYHES